MKRLLPLFLLLSGCVPVSSLGTATSTTISGPGPVPKHCHVRGTGLFALPDPSCTPGALNPDVTQATIHSTICHSGWSSRQRPPVSVTEPEKQVIAGAYGYTGPLHAVELDHEIPISIGGALNDYRNYWIEENYPHPRFVLNPKDQLEFNLRRRVCDGKMSLATAQHVISTDWVAAYHQFVR